jgi:hypothetical protein
MNKTAAGPLNNVITIDEFTSSSVEETERPFGRGATANCATTGSMWNHAGSGHSQSAKNAPTHRGCVQQAQGLRAYTCRMRITGSVDTTTVSALIKARHWRRSRGADDSSSYRRTSLVGDRARPVVTSWLETIRLLSGLPQRSWGGFDESGPQFSWS